jgi:hypothetical protein
LQEFFPLFDTEFEHTSPSAHEQRFFLPLLFLCVTLTCPARLRSSTQCCPPNISSITIDYDVTFRLEEVASAIEQALQLGTISFDAVKHLLLGHLERRPPRLDLENYPHLPPAQVHTTQASEYMTLLSEVPW